MQTSSTRRIGRILAALALGASALAQAAPTYRITVIESGSGYPGARINDAGMVAGSAHVASDPWQATTRPFRWTAAEGLVFSSYGDQNSSVSAMNLDDAGNVAGQWTKPEWPERVVVWDGVNAKRLDKGRLMAGNSRGDLLGYIPEGSNNPRVVWMADGRRIRIDLPHDASPAAMNNRRQIVGHTYDAFAVGAPDEATIWSFSGEPRKLGYLPNAGRRGSYGYDINDAGEVTGQSFDEAGTLVPFYWSEATGMMPIAVIDNCNFHDAVAINAQGVVVGRSNDCLGSLEAWVWTLSQGAHFLIDLIDPADPLRDDVSLGSSVSDINAAGQIVLNGTARVRDAAVRWKYVTILLTPN